jgi:hypothetical protein
MAHFAKIENGTVTQVLVVDNEHEHDGQNYLANELGLGGHWVQTSYNNKIRGKFAGIGDVYDPNTDQFFPAQPFPSWLLSGSGWIAPVPKPDGNVVWDEDSKTWKAAE